MMVDRVISPLSDQPDVGHAWVNGSTLCRVKLKGVLFAGVFGVEDCAFCLQRLKLLRIKV